jgi:hypothetical protein
VPFITAFEDTAVIQWGVVIGASLTAAIWDLRTQRRPNVLKQTRGDRLVVSQYSFRADA